MGQAGAALALACVPRLPDELLAVLALPRLGHPTEVRRVELRCGCPRLAFLTAQELRARPRPREFKGHRHCVLACVFSPNGLCDM